MNNKMNNKMDTIDLKGKAYATVPTRIKEFRKDCPSGLIETTPMVQADGQTLFKARILKDKSNPSSGEATGHSLGTVKGEKSFEKLETIAVGRALALLGYMASGDIASSEEMENFYEYKLERQANALKSLESAKTFEELKKIYLALDGNLQADKMVIDLKNKLKTKLK